MNFVHPVLKPIGLEKTHTTIAEVFKPSTSDTFQQVMDANINIQHDLSAGSNASQHQKQHLDQEKTYHQSHSPRIHFLPQQLSSPAFPISPVVSTSPSSIRRFSHQTSSPVKSCWDESLEQLSRELQMICHSGSKENLSNTSLNNSRSSSPVKASLTVNLNSEPKVHGSTHSLSPSPFHDSNNLNLLNSGSNVRRVSLNIELFEHQDAFSRLEKVMKGDEKSSKCHRSHEDMLENSPPLKSILKPSSNNQPLEIKSVGIEPDKTQHTAEESNDHVFSNDFPKPDFGFPELTLKKIKVRHEETEVSLNRTLAKICRNKNVILVQKEIQETLTSSGSTVDEGRGPENPIENQLNKLESPVVCVVSNIQQLFQNRHIQTAAESGQLEQISETMSSEINKEIVFKDQHKVKINKEFSEIHTSSENRTTGSILKSSLQCSRGQKTAQELQVGRRSHTVTSIQAFRRKKLLKFSEGAKSLGRSIENVQIRFKVDLNERNPYTIGVSVDEETGFLTVFAATYHKAVNYDSGFGDTPSIGSNMSDKLGENFGTHKPSISSDISDSPLTSAIEQLHLLRLGESTKPECLRCSIEDGVLRIREIESEAEFLNFEGINTKYLPIVSEDLTNCTIAVTLFVPQEFRGSVSVKTIDDILVLTGTKGQFSDNFGSRTSQDVSDDDDGYEAASELSSHSSLNFTPPSISCIPFQSTQAGRESISSMSSSTQAIPISSQASQPSSGAQTFKVALNLPPETITRTIEAWMDDCGQLIITGQTTGVGRRMTCNF